MICKWKNLFIFILSIYVSTANEESYEPLREAKCVPVDLLVELPIEQATYYKLSSTHAYVTRCMGVNDEKRACVSKDQVAKRENWRVIKNTGSGKKESIYVSWLSHETCGYERRSKCPIEAARECHERSTTHYYDEVNCTCSCIVQIDGENTCYARVAAVASTTVIWLPILTFLLGVVVSAVVLYFKFQQNKILAPRSSFNNSNTENPPASPSTGHPAIGFTDIEQPVDPPTRHTVNKFEYL